jgi:hypothetical protein
MPDHPFRRKARDPYRGSTKGTAEMMMRRRRPLMRAAWVHPADLIAVGLIAAEEAVGH